MATANTENVTRDFRQLVLAYDLEYLRLADYERLTSAVIEIKRMLTSFIQKLKAGR